MVYRQEIDGLWALTVLPIILFHTGSEIFIGGDSHRPWSSTDIS